MMNNEEGLRSISKDTLNSKEIKNAELKEILESFPDVEKILKYARRRKNPQISETITDENLKQKMLESRLSDEDYLITFLKIIKMTFGNKKPVTTGKPSADILMAQTGAGKTKLCALVQKGNPNTAVIDPDQYKMLMPNAEKIRKEDPINFGALTGIDGYDLARNLLDFAIDNKYNILLEVAPYYGKKGKIGNIDLEQLESKNYNINFHVLAVGDIFSNVRIHKRYHKHLKSKKKDKKENAKLTNPLRHRESFDALIPMLEQNLDLNKHNIKIYRRLGDERIELPINKYTKEEVLKLIKLEQLNSNCDYLASGKFTKHINKLKENKNMTIEERKQIEDIEKEVKSKYMYSLDDEKFKKDEEYERDER